VTTTYSIRILKAAIQDLEKLDSAVAKRMVKRIYWLAENLDTLKPSALKGELSGLFKLRDGDYRIIYQILHAEKMIIIHAVGNRKEIYR
jgi:mRNA interferase RelE/StbE